MANEIQASELAEIVDGGLIAPEAEVLAAAIQYGTALVSAYCRGRHVFGDGTFRPGVRECILSVAARYAQNPTGAQTRVQAGGFSASVGAGGQGLSLGERYILSRYRKKAM